MSRLATLAREDAPAASAALLDGVERQLGVVPNMFKMVAQSPAALGALLSFSGALAKTLDVRTRERIAIAVAQENDCDYCLSAHTYLGLNLAKLDGAEVALNRKGASTDPKADAAVRFAVKVAKTRGGVADDDIAAVRAAGFTAAQIIDIVSLVAENILTNLLNKVAGTDIDFPAVHAAEAA
jgi:uncharacterized peroxidase-related enzyme